MKQKIWIWCEGILFFLLLLGIFFDFSGENLMKGTIETNVEMKDIGVIEVLEYQSYVEILNGKGNLVLNHLNKRKIKNKSIVVEKAKG